MGVTTKKSCKNCIYSYNVTDTLIICDYLLKTNKRRPCPAGKGCTAKIKRKKGKKDVKN